MSRIAVFGSVAVADARNDPAMAALRKGKPAIWLRPPGRVPTGRAVEGVTPEAVAEAVIRLERFVPALRGLFPDSDWDGRIGSGLLDYPQTSPQTSRLTLPRGLLLKADHALPLTGSIKARGGIYELLCWIERIATIEGLLRPGDTYDVLATPRAAAVFARHKIVVASTGNLGFSIGFVARAFGLLAEIHLSYDAKPWKKQRLRDLGAAVIEHDSDYTETAQSAREAAAASNSVFIDDETSRELLIGYATAADELIAQLQARGLVPTVARPLVVYMPCGVGGSPAGVTFGLKARLGDAVRCVFAEPIASACVFAAMAVGQGKPVSVYDLGLDNLTVAEGLAVPLASALALDVAGDHIDAIAAVSDAQMLDWVRHAWREAGLRLEPSAAASLAAAAICNDVGIGLDDAIHVAWTTGGAAVPDGEFAAALDD